MHHESLLYVFIIAKVARVSVPLTRTCGTLLQCNTINKNLKKLCKFTASKSARQRRADALCVCV
jgi:hypothetical protein